MSQEKQACRNPWKKCRNDDVYVYIQYEGRVLPVCRECWTEIAESNREWGRD